MVYEDNWMIYHYICLDCGKNFSHDVPMTSRIENGKHINAKCSSCKSKNVKKLLNSAPVHFRGSGFYSTDKDKK